MTGIELLGAVVVVGVVLAFGKSTLDKLFHRTSPSAAQVALTAEKASAAKTGQQFAAATTKEIALVKDQTDPAVVAAKKTSARADLALQTGLGAFTPAQAQWVQNLVEADAAAFNIAIEAKDKELAQSGDRIASLEKKVAAESGRAGWFENLLILVVIIYVAINFVLPWLERLFPPLGLITGAITAVANPFLSSMKAKAKADLAKAEDKLQGLYSQAGQAVADMRAKMGTLGKDAIAHIDNNLDNDHLDAIAEAARAAAADAAAAQAAAKAQVEITS